MFVPVNYSSFSSIRVRVGAQRLPSPRQEAQSGRQGSLQQIQVSPETLWNPQYCRYCDFRRSFSFLFVFPSDIFFYLKITRQPPGCSERAELFETFQTGLQIHVWGVHAAKPPVLPCGSHLVHVTAHLLRRLATSQAGVGVRFRPQFHPPAPRRQQIQVRQTHTGRRWGRSCPPQGFLASHFAPCRVLPDLPQAGMRNSPITVRSDPPRRLNSPIRVPPPGQCALVWTFHSCWLPCSFTLWVFFCHFPPSDSESESDDNSVPLQRHSTSYSQDPLSRYRYR